MVNETTNLREIKDKIAKLLAKAEGTDNPFEQMMFMGKVNELLERYEMDMFEIRAHAGIDNDPMGEQQGEFNVYASMMWAKMTLHWVAKYYGARIVWNPKQKNHLPYQVFGRESARVTAELMIPYVVSQVRQQARRYKQDNPRTYDWKPMTDSVAQREVGMALASRLSRLANENEAKRNDLASKSLVPFDATQAFMDNYFGANGLKHSRKSKKGYSGAAAAYADKISLNKQATGAGARLQIK